ncbi:ABC transporter ATP-binding protein [Erysipelotrichaceae bacterium 51-3]
MTEALKIEHLNKQFKHFALQEINLTVKKGMVVGLIGENGSGKSTTLRCVVNQDVPDDGTITIFGQNAQTDPDIHKKLGVVSDGSCFPDVFSAQTISRIMKDIFPQWEEEYFFGFLKRFSVPADQPLRQFSKGMKAKLRIACALAHHPDLLLLDEATEGLDPVVWEEILDLLQEFMESDDHAILMTSHISSDLERIADQIAYIQDGKIRFELTREQIDRLGIAQLAREQMEFIDPALVMAVRRQPLHTETLITDRFEFKKRYPDYAISPASLDEIIVMISKGEKQG